MTSTQHDPGEPGTETPTPQRGGPGSRTQTRRLVRSASEGQSPAPETRRPARRHHGGDARRRRSNRGAAQHLAPGADDPGRAEGAALMRYTILVTPDDGQYAVRVPAMPSIFTWGTTTDQALTLAREAIELHLEQYLERGLPFPHDRHPVSRAQTARVVMIDVEAPERQVAS